MVLSNIFWKKLKVFLSKFLGIDLSLFWRLYSWIHFPLIRRAAKRQARMKQSIPVFRRSTRKFPSFSSCHFFISFPASRFFLYLQQIFNALLGLFLLKKFFWYIIIIVLYSTLFGGRLWHTILRKENKKKGTYLQMYESHWDKEKKQSMGIF